MGYLTKLTNSVAHPGHTIYLTTVGEPFECDGCHELGIGYGYQCKAKGCGRIFHEECARPQEITSHPLSKGCHFTFSHPPNAPAFASAFYRICDACGTHARGFFYACYKHGKYGHFIHPSCMTLKHRIVDGCVMLELKGDAKNKCDDCGHKHASEGIKGWSYCSSDGDLCLHIKCVKDRAMENWRTVYLNQRNMMGSSSSIISNSSSISNNNIISSSSIISNYSFITNNSISSSKLMTITSKSTMTPAIACRGETSTSPRRGKGIIVAYKGTSNFKEYAQKVMKLLKLATRAIVRVLFGSITAAPLDAAVIQALVGG